MAELSPGGKMKQLTNKEKLQTGLLALSVLIMIIGILFLVNAMQELPENGFFPAFCAIDNILAKYIIVIITMACGIMLFSNVAVTLENKKLRDGMTIGITTFSTILTVPLVYVFVSILPYAANPKPFEELNAVDAIMRTDRIYDGFVMWFGDEALLWVVLVFMLLLSLVFITFPLLTGILAVKEKALVLDKKGLRIGTLPVVAKQRDAENAGSADDGTAASEEEAALLAEAATDKED